MLDEKQNDNLFPTILSMFMQGKIFVKCPNCGKHLGLLEIYNENCAYCGKTPFGEMMIVKGMGILKEEENEQQENDDKDKGE